MLKKIQETLKKYHMLNQGETILAAVSGGPDSVALLHALWQLRQELGICLKVVHVNHNLRGEDSRQDALFVSRFAEGLDLECYIKETDVIGYSKNSGLSKQVAARELRYRLFEEVAAEAGASKIALGHNANDQLETVVMNFLKGSGPEGLTGIPPVRGSYFRPLIETTREEIIAYCRANNLSPVLDKTNLEPVYLRNQIRLELIPLLEKEYNPSLVKTVLKLTEILRDEDELINCLANQHKSEVIKSCQQDRIIIDNDKLICLPMAIQRRVVRQVWQELTSQSQGLFFGHIADILNLAHRGVSGSYLNLPQGVKVLKSYNHLIFGYNVIKNEVNYFRYELSVPGQTAVPELGTVIKCSFVEKDDFAGCNLDDMRHAFLDWEEIKWPLIVRQRLPGDRFQPLGAPGNRKLKDFLIDKKVPRWERDTIPVVCSGPRIVWVAGFSVAEPFRVKPRTNKILHLEVF